MNVDLRLRRFRLEISEKRSAFHKKTPNPLLKFFKNHAKNVAGRIVPDLLFSKKALYDIKTSRLQLSFNIFR